MSGALAQNKHIQTYIVMTHPFLIILFLELRTSCSVPMWNILGRPV